ncbi:hypothetical protein NW762_007569 [Fusarium torreyae]|uniref:HMG box domain-containing protein n=1 Tax=Fusarium torreyae TaxID=1237075 RepID=A0A9W8VG23_9HYPO|nr:hypothetical protein NW762_007569 [Fusarium torreyae]
MSNLILLPPGSMIPAGFSSDWNQQHIDSVFACLKPKPDEKNNPTKIVVVIPSELYQAMDAGAKAGIANLFMMYYKEPVMYARDGNGCGCYYIGTPRDFASGGGMIVNITGAPEAVWVCRPDKSAQTKIPRPPNAYILYRKERHQLVKQNNPGITNNEISQVLGKCWNMETREVRARYKQKADQLKEEHRQMYPDYQYRPRRTGEKRRRSTVPRAGTSTVTAQFSFPALGGVQQNNV